MDTPMMKNPLASLLSQTWWLMMLRGIVAILFGLLCCFQPFFSLNVLVIFFGAYALVDGVLAVVSSIQGRKTHQDWWVLLLWGLVSVITGALTLAVPPLAILVLVYYFAAWAIVTGVMEIIAAIRLRGEALGRGWLIIGGLLSVLFGILLFARPGSSIVVIGWLIGIFAILLGIIFVALAFHMRRISKELQNLN